MMKKEFDKIAIEMGYDKCNPDMYLNEIEPTYMRWGQDEMLTHEEMVRMYWGIEPWDFGTWAVLNGSRQVEEATKTAWEKTEEAFAAVGRTVPELVKQGFQEQMKHLEAVVHAKVAVWREKSKKSGKAA